MRFFLATVLSLFGLPAKAGLSQYFHSDKSPCELALTTDSALEQKLKEIYARLSIMDLNPARSIHPAEMSEILEVVSRGQVELASVPKAAGAVQQQNLLRVSLKFAEIRAKLESELSVFSTQIEIRRILNYRHNQLNGALYEALISNRLISLNPVLGKTMRDVYPDAPVGKKDRIKELDIVLPRSAGRHDIWIEVKHIASEGMATDKEYPWIDRSRKRLIKQLRKTVEIRNRIDPAIKIYLVSSSSLAPSLIEEIRQMHIEIIQFSAYGE